MVISSYKLTLFQFIILYTTHSRGETQAQKSRWAAPTPDGEWVYVPGGLKPTHVAIGSSHGCMTVSPTSNVMCWGIVDVKGAQANGAFVYLSSSKIVNQPSYFLAPRPITDVYSSSSKSR